MSPMRTLFPRAVSAGSTALFPMKTRRPIFTVPRVNQPERTRWAPSIPLEAIMHSPPMSKRSGYTRSMVAISQRGPIRAPRARSQGAMNSVS